MRVPCSTLLALLLAAAGLRAQSVTDSVAQETILARRGGGIRAGVWNVRKPDRPEARFSSWPHITGFVQRGIGEHLALESSAGLWRRTSSEVAPLTGNDVMIDTYVLPLQTSLVIFPVTSPEQSIEPYIIAGIGFAFGIENVGENAIGGGGTSVATGFGFNTGLGVAYHVTRVFGLLAAGEYNWIKFGDELDGQSTLQGAGFQAGITYRFR